MPRSSTLGSSAPARPPGRTGAAEELSLSSMGSSVLAAAGRKLVPFARELCAVRCQQRSRSGRYRAPEEAFPARLESPADALSSHELANASWTRLSSRRRAPLGPRAPSSHRSHYPEYDSSPTRRSDRMRRCAIVHHPAYSRTSAPRRVRWEAWLTKARATRLRHRRSRCPTTTARRSRAAAARCCPCGG